MKILVALSRFPWPLEKGDKLRAYYQLKGLAKDHDVHLVCLNEKKVSQNELDQLSFCSSVSVLPIPRLKRLWNLVGGFFNDLPFQVNYFKSSPMSKAISGIIQDEKIDVVMVQLIRLGMNLPFREGNHQPGWFLDYMDCFSIGMENRVSEARWPAKSVVKWEAKRLKSYEQKIAAQFDEFAMISDRDAAGLPKALQGDVHVLPNGVGEHFFESLPTLPAKRYDLVFFGNMGYQPNVQSAKYLVEEVLPELEQLGVKAKVCIAGARPAKLIQGYASDSIEVTGFVDDIREYVLASRLAIAPVIGGQGLQNKLIESMALGIPTLTTPHAHEGLGAEATKEVIVCDSPRIFAAQIAHFLSEPEQAQAVGEAGKAFVERHYRWDAMNRQLEKILQEAAGIKLKS